MERSPPGEQRDAPHVATHRTNLDLDAGVQGIIGLTHVESTLAPRKEHGDQRREVLVHVGEGGGEGLHDLFIERAQHLLQLSARVTHVTDLGVEFLVALFEGGELFEGERVDRTERGDAGFEFGDARVERDALGQVDVGRRSHLMRLDAEVAHNEFVNVGDLDGEFRVFDLVAPHDLAEFGQARVGVVSRPAHLFEHLGARASGLELFAVGRVHRFLGDSNLIGRALDESRQSRQRLDVELEQLTLVGRRLAFARATL